MSQSERPADLLKRVTSATVKAIANRPELEVHFQASGASASEGSVNLPAPSGPPSAEGITKLRGVSDALALRLRFHDADLHRKLAPAGPDSHAVFEALPPRLTWRHSRRSVYANRGWLSPSDRSLV